MSPPMLLLLLYIVAITRCDVVALAALAAGLVFAASVAAMPDCQRASCYQLNKAKKKTTRFAYSLSS